jgi:methylated-DNA-[protein]-cysteine S-methyltransferase
MEILHTAYCESPLGPVEVKGNEQGIVSVSFIENSRVVYTGGAAHPAVEECVTQLNEYFKGKRKEFTVLLNPQGTDFQKKVWESLLLIPYGKTASYLDIALKVADKNATRAVGSANGQNRIAIIIPCHRVIGSNRQLTGYAGGMWRKKWLLVHEGVLAPDKQLALF